MGTAKCVVGVAITAGIAVAGLATGVLPNKRASPELSGRGFLHLPSCLFSSAQSFYPFRRYIESNVDGG